MEGEGHGEGARETWFYGRACSIARPQRNREKPARRRGSGRWNAERIAREREREAREERKKSATAQSEREREKEEDNEAEREKEEVCIRTRHTAIVLRPGRSGMRKSPDPLAPFSPRHVT